MSLRPEWKMLASVLQAASSQVTGEQLSGRAINEARERTERKYLILLERYGCGAHLRIRQAAAFFAFLL